MAQIESTRSMEMEIPIIFIAIAVVIAVAIAHIVNTKQILLRDFTQGRQSQFRELKISLVIGALAMLVFLCLTIVIGFLDRQYTWTPQNIWAIVVVSLLAGLVVGLVSLVGLTWSFFVIGKYRDFLYPRLREDQIRKKISKSDSNKSE